MPDSWYALYVQTRHEKNVTALLRNKGFDTCLPLIRSKRQWSDRQKLLDIPAFPGYVFCAFDAQRRAPVLGTPGVIAIVGAGRAPIPIDLAEIDSVRAIERAHFTGEYWPYLKTGEQVRIESGPLNGLTGILLDCRKSARVVVSVALLQRSVALEVDRWQIVPVHERSRSAGAGHFGS